VVLGTLITAIGSIITFITSFIGIMGTVIAFMAPVVAALGTVVVAIGVWPLVIGAALILVVALIVTHWTQVTNFLKTTWDWITALFNTSLAGIQLVWSTVWGAVAGFFEGIWSGVKNSLTDALSFVRSEIGAFVSWAEGVFGPVLSAVTSIGSVASGFGKTIGGAVSSVLPKFAAGGIVNSPTIGLIGEAGPEAIIPLSLLGSGGGSSNNGTGGITINISGGQYYTDRQSVTDFANKIAKLINQQIKVSNYSS
jgi:phage-related protein